MRALVLGLIVAATMTAGAYAASPQSPAAGESWRYCWNDNHWWYWRPEGRWVYWSDGRWNNYPAPMPHVTAYPSEFSPVAAFPQPSTEDQIRPFYGHSQSVFGTFRPESLNSEAGPFYGHAIPQSAARGRGGEEIGPFYGHAVSSYGG